MNLPDLFEIQRDALVTARSVLYFLTFAYGYFAGHWTGHHVVRHAKRVHSYMKRKVG